jgi:cell wall-associated NlpC family hydrolase
MGLLHRLRRRRTRRGKGALIASGIRRVPFPAPSSFRIAALLACVFALGLGVFWSADTGAAQAVPTSTTVTTSFVTTSTEFTLQGEVKAQVDTLTAQAQKVQADIAALDDELEQKTEAYNQCLDDLDTSNARMSELRRTVADAQADKAQRQALLGQRLKAVYMSGGRDQLLQMLLLANGLDDLYNRVRLVSTLAGQDQQLVSDLKDSSTKLDLLLKAQDDQKRQELRLREDLANRAKEIQTTLAQKQQTLASLDANVKTIVEAEQARQKAEQERLQAELQAKLQAEFLAAQAAAQVAAQNHVLNGGQIYQGTLPQTDNAITNQLVQTAAAYMGIPYVWGGSKPSTGMDCSGFVRYVFKQHGVILPHYSGYQAQMGVPVALADIQPGDLVAFGFPVHHVGIYIGDGLFIHTPGDYVKIQKLSSRTNLAAIRRFPLQMRTGDPLFE